MRQGYCCSQLLLLLMLQAQDRQNPDLVRAMHGLCHGIGQSDGPCGQLPDGSAADEGRTVRSPAQHMRPGP